MCYQSVFIFTLRFKMGLSVNSSTSPPPVTSQPDLRPTADAAAIAHDKNPEIPLPMPASLAPVASVNQSRISKFDKDDPAGMHVDRTLAPYGVSMLPESDASAKAKLDLQPKHNTDENVVT